MNIDYNAVIEILKSFLNNEKTEILGISVGEERQVRESIKNLLTAYEEKCKEVKKEIQDDLDVRNRWGLTLQELEKEKEKNKELTERVLKLESDKFWDNVVSKSKIKAKVIEIKDRPVKDEFITASQGKLNTIIDIESLLDEEE